MNRAHPEIIEAGKVAVIGATGFFGSMTLGQVNLLVSIAVGLVTLAYVSTKFILLLRSRNRPPAEGE